MMYHVIIRRSVDRQIASNSRQIFSDRLDASAPWQFRVDVLWKYYKQWWFGSGDGANVQYYWFLLAPIRADRLGESAISISKPYFVRRTLECVELDENETNKSFVIWWTEINRNISWNSLSRTNTSSIPTWAVCILIITIFFSFFFFFSFESSFPECWLCGVVCSHPSRSGSSKIWRA